MLQHYEKIKTNLIKLQLYCIIFIIQIKVKCIYIYALLIEVH